MLAAQGGGRAIGNAGIGMSDHDIEVLSAAVDYLRR
jgi:hypothetical protein